MAMTLQPAPPAVDAGGGAVRGSSVSILAVAFLVASSPVFIPKDSIVLWAMVALTLAMYLNTAALPTTERSPVVLPTLLAVTLVYLVATALWSDEPSTTLVQAFLTIAVSAFALVAAHRTNMATLAAGIFAGSALACWLSLLLVVISPHIAFNEGTYNTGALQGIYAHRNILSYVAAMGLLVLVSSGHTIWNRRSTVALGALGILGALVLARSATAAATLAICAALVFSLRFLRRVPKPYGGFVTALAVATLVWIGALFWSGLGALTTLFGRDVTLTGRTYIWQAVIPFIQARPLLGYGWSAVWDDDAVVGPAVRQVVKFDEATHAHDSYLDIALQAGLIGLALVLLLIVMTLRRAYRFMWTDSALPLWPVVGLIGLCSYSLAESRLNRPLGWLLLVLLLSATGREVRTSTDTV